MLESDGLQGAHPAQGTVWVMLPTWGLLPEGRGQGTAWTPVHLQFFSSQTQVAMDPLLPVLSVFKQARSRIILLVIAIP